MRRKYKVVYSHGRTGYPATLENACERAHRAVNRKFCKEACVYDRFGFLHTVVRRSPVTGNIIIRYF